MLGTPPPSNPQPRPSGAAPAGSCCGTGVPRLEPQEQEMECVSNCNSCPYQSLSTTAWCHCEVKGLARRCPADRGAACPTVLVTSPSLLPAVQLLREHTDLLSTDIAGCCYVSSPSFSVQPRQTMSQSRQFEHAFKAKGCIRAQGAVCQGVCTVPESATLETIHRRASAENKATGTGQHCMYLEDGSL